MSLSFCMMQSTLPLKHKSFIVRPTWFPLCWQHWEIRLQQHWTNYIPFREKHWIRYSLTICTVAWHLSEQAGLKVVNWCNKLFFTKCTYIIIVISIHYFLHVQCQSHSNARKTKFFMRVDAPSMENIAVYYSYQYKLM